MLRKDTIMVPNARLLREAYNDEDEDDNAAADAATAANVDDDAADESIAAHAAANAAAIDWKSEWVKKPDQSESFSVQAFPPIPRFSGGAQDDTRHASGVRGTESKLICELDRMVC